jgi:hypothetical protein
VKNPVFDCAVVLCTMEKKEKKVFQVIRLALLALDFRSAAREW